MGRMSDKIVTFDEMEQHGNNCRPAQCLRCNHADMLHVKRDGSYVRCGCKSGRHLGTWSIGYPFVSATEECPDFSEVTDECRKQQINVAWIISCERLMQSFRRPEMRPVGIGDTFVDYRIPFPEAINKLH